MLRNDGPAWGYPRIKAPAVFRGARLIALCAPRSRAAGLRTRILCDERLEPGRALEIDFHLEGGTPVRCTARVAGVDPLPAESGAGYDVRLDVIAVPPEERGRLEAALVY